MEFVDAPANQTNRSATAPGRRPPSQKASSHSARILFDTTDADASKYGMQKDDHHDERGPSPPPKHSALYDYLPRTDANCGEIMTAAQRAKLRARLVPPKLCIEAKYSHDPDSPMRLQMHILGVYELLEKGKMDDGKEPVPVWKHSREDLILEASTVEGQPGWVIAHVSSNVLSDEARTGEQKILRYDEYKDRRSKEAPKQARRICARILGPDPPFKDTETRFQVWDGRKWISAKVMSRPPRLVIIQWPSRDHPLRKSSRSTASHSLPSPPLPSPPSHALALVSSSSPAFLTGQSEAHLPRMGASLGQRLPSKYDRHLRSRSQTR